MFVVPVVSFVALVLCVLLHYELLVSVTRIVARYEFSHRTGIVAAALRATLSHIIQVWIFAFGYQVILWAGEGYGTIIGSPVESFKDLVYLSFVVYSTLGFGDMVPTGSLRFMVGTEAITGLVMIAWTASFLFLETQKQWGVRNK